MPVYDAEATVVRAARSILDGDWQDLELVAVDDGSSDRSIERLCGLDDSRVRVLAVPHEGIATALNRGVAAARAPVIARMDADDVSHPERIGRQLARLAEGDVQMVGCAVRIVDSGGAAVPSMRRYERWINSLLEPEAIAAMRFVESPLVHPTVMATRNVFETGYREGPWPEDYDLWLRAMARGRRAVKLGEPLLDWTDSASRLTRRSVRYSSAAFDACKRFHLLEGPLRNSGTVDLWGAGQTGKPWLRWLQGVGLSVRRLIEISPRKIGERIHGVEVLPPDDLAEADGTPMLIAVGAAGARELIQDHLEKRGYGTGKDAWFVA